MVVDLLFQEEYRTRKSYIGELSREGNGSRARACRKARSLAISTVTGGEISGGKVGNFQAEKTLTFKFFISVFRISRASCPAESKREEMVLRSTPVMRATLRME